jgi:hypothetical protein
MYRSTKEIVDAPDVEDVAEQVIKDKGIDLSMCEVRYVKMYPNISKTTVGQCRVANRREHFFSGADYIILMSGEIWDDLDDDRRYILTWHELKHIHPTYSEKRGEWRHQVKGHDVEDFADIINEHGTDWISDLRTIVGSYYDLDPEKQDKVSL